jgi:hypothetical protein
MTHPPPWAALLISNSEDAFLPFATAARLLNVHFHKSSGVVSCCSIAFSLLGRTSLLVWPFALLADPVPSRGARRLRDSPQHSVLGHHSNNRFNSRDETRA